MTTFVLVHGSFHGGWCWWKVAPILRAAGHQVYAPSLSGLGDRSHLLSPEISLETHVQDIQNILFYEDLRDAILVGHSYGTAVVTMAADREPDRVSRLVLFDGTIPENGMGLFEQILPERRALLERQIATEGEGWYMPASFGGTFGVSNPEDIAWMAERLGPHPARASQEPVQLTGAVDRIPKAFINCTDRPLGSYIEPFAWRAREEGWAYIDLPTGHDAMVTMPHEVAGFLLSLVAPPP